MPSKSIQTPQEQVFDFDEGEFAVDFKKKWARSVTGIRLGFAVLATQGALIVFYATGGASSGGILAASLFAVATGLQAVSLRGSFITKKEIERALEEELLEIVGETPKNKTRLQKKTSARPDRGWTGQTVESAVSWVQETGSLLRLHGRHIAIQAGVSLGRVDEETANDIAAIHVAQRETGLDALEAQMRANASKSKSTTPHFSDVMISHASKSSADPDLSSADGVSPDRPRAPK